MPQRVVKTSGENFSKYLKIRPLQNLESKVKCHIFAKNKKYNMNIKELETEDSKRKIATIVNSLINLNTSKTTTYIRINDEDELVLDEYFTIETGTPFIIDNKQRYIKVDMPNIHIKDDVINSHLKCMGIHKEEDELIYNLYYWWLFKRITREEVIFQLEEKILEYNDKSNVKIKLKSENN